MNIIKQIKEKIEILRTCTSEFNYQNAVGYNWALDDMLSFLFLDLEEKSESPSGPTIEEPIDGVLYAAACGIKNATGESEKPMNQEGLEQEIIKCWQEWISPSNKQSVEGVLPLSEFAFYARHFAEWGAEHLKK